VEWSLAVLSASPVSTGSVLYADLKYGVAAEFSIISQVFHCSLRSICCECCELLSVALLASTDEVNRGMVSDALSGTRFWYDLPQAAGKFAYVVSLIFLYID